MGAWGIGSFENDDALDWLSELVAEGLPASGFAIQAVLDQSGEYLEAPSCSQAIAASEIIAAMLGRPASDLPDDANEWLSRNSQPPGAELVANARQALERIVNNSELRDLWSETSDRDRWLASVQGLRDRPV